MTDEEYEAELHARTPEQWNALQDKALADGNDIVALQHLMWRRDAKDLEYVRKLAKPDMSLEDKDYALRKIGEIADTLRAARDNPEERERDRWQRVMFAAAVIGSSEAKYERTWLESARDYFPAARGKHPADDAPLLEHAIYAVESLLDALLMKPEDRAELKQKMDSALTEFFGPGIRRGTPYDKALQKQKQGIISKVSRARCNAAGQFEMFGAEIIPLKPRNKNDWSSPPTGPEAA